MHELTKAYLEFPPSRACHLVSKYSGTDPKDEQQRLCQLCNQLILLQPAQIPTYPNTWITSSVALTPSMSYPQILNSIALTPSISQCVQIMSSVALTQVFYRPWILSHWHQVSTGKALANKRKFGHCSIFLFSFCTFICSGSLLTMKRSAPRSSQASFSFPGDVLKTVTVIPKAFPNLTAMWPKPPKPTTPKCLPATSIWKCFIGL